MKISRLEFVALLLAAVFLSFSAGWFLRGEATAQPVQVEIARRPTPAEVVVTLPAPTPTPAPTPAGTPVPAPTPTGVPAVVNINTADVAELESLPGIGEKRAQDIVDYRTTHGPFRIPEDITKVKGIGEGTLAHIIDFITTGEGHP